MVHVDSFLERKKKGSLEVKKCNIYVKADVSSDTCGRTHAGEHIGQDIQVKEAEVLLATLSIIVKKMSGEIRGKNLVCKLIIRF